MGTCGLVGPIGVWTGWARNGGGTALDWLGLALVAIVLPAVLAPLLAIPLRRAGWIKPGDLKL
jgi:uncharacterized membrane protein